jgi:hypothetical protein
MPQLEGSASTDSARCVIDSMGGTTHNYRYCIRAPPLASEYMVGGGPTSLQNVGKVFTEISKYVDYLIISPNKATAEECRDLVDDKYLLGNKYVLKTGLKCIPVDLAGKIQCGPNNLPLEKTLHKYINNVSDGSNFLTGGRENKAGNGLIQSTVGNLGTLASNIAGVATSFAEETKPYCMAAVVKCHIVAGNSSSQNYSGLSPLSLHFSLDDLESMKNTDFAGDLKPKIPLKKDILNTCISGNGFRNIEELQIDAINNNIINQNLDKLIYTSNIDSIIDNINFNDNTLVKVYYLGISLLMILIMFKILYGKQKI